MISTLVILVRWYEPKKTCLYKNHFADKTYEGVTRDKILFHDTDPIIIHGLSILRSGHHSGAFYPEL